MPPLTSADLPPKGSVVPLARILELCEARGLNRTLKRITDAPPPKPFKSDGCSLFFDQIAGISIYPACFFHDIKYWSGFPEVNDAERLERFLADAELMVDVAMLGVDVLVAETMFRGVRIGGGPFKLPFSWGFGRD